MSENWKERFFKLLLMNGNKFEDAIRLKSKNMPTKLYRYRPIAKQENFNWVVESIRNETIYCSRRTDLNDPFEMSTSLSSMDFESYLADYPLAKSAEFAPLQQAVMPELEKQNSEWNDIPDMVKVACFTETSSNLPMWAHYADNHAGICLEYDIQHMHENLANIIFPVKYVEELLDTVKFAMGCKASKSSSNVLTYQCVQKLSGWSYEKEWRYVFVPSMKKEYHEKLPSNYLGGWEKIHFGRPSKIILGSKICQDKQSKLRDLASEFSINIAKMEVTPYGLR